METHQAFSIVSEKLIRWLHGLVATMPNLVAAIVIVLVFWLASRIARNLVGHVAHRITNSAQASRLLSQVSAFALVVAGLFVALGVLGLEKTVTSLLTGVGILGLTLGFALQDITSNLMAGILIEARHPFVVGDVIESGDFCGRVDNITLRATEMTKLDGQVVLIPNKDIFNKPVINHTRTRSRRIEVELPVPEGRRLQELRDGVRDAVAREKNLDNDHEIELFFKNTPDGVLHVLIRFWIASSHESDYLRAKSAAILAVKDAMESGQQTMPQSRAS